jgi:excisionase family DNA binding protein
VSNNNDPLSITVAETKRLSGLGITTIYQCLKDGRLQAVHVGKRRLVVYASLKQLLTPSNGSAPKRGPGRPRKVVR